MMKTLAAALAILGVAVTVLASLSGGGAVTARDDGARSGAVLQVASLGE